MLIISPDPFISQSSQDHSPQPLCVQMDFTRTLCVEANAKCNNKNHDWNYFYKILVVLKYQRRPWANIFGTYICRSIDIPKKCQIHQFNVGIYASSNVCIKDIDSRASLVLQNCQKFTVLNRGRVNWFAKILGGVWLHALRFTWMYVCIFFFFQIPMYLLSYIPKIPLGALTMWRKVAL